MGLTTPRFEINQQTRMDKSASYELLKKNLQNLLQIQDTKEIFDLIGHDLSHCIPNSIIIVNEVTHNEKTTITRGIFGVKQPLLSNIFSQLGKNPIGVAYKLREDFQNLYQNSGIHPFNENLQAFSNNTFGSQILKKMERLLDIKKIYSTAFKQKGKLVAVVHIFMQHEEKLPNKDLALQMLNQTEIVYQNKLYQIELEKRENKLQEALKTSSSGYWEWNFHTNKTKYSHQFAHMLGCKPDDFGSTISCWEFLIHPDDKKAILNKIKHYTQRGLPFSFEYRILFRDGKYRWIESVGKNYTYDKNQNPESLIIVNRDIHSNKIAEEALEKTKNRYQQLANLTFEGIILHQNGVCLDVNPAFMSITGYSKKEIIGKELVKVLFEGKQLKKVENAFENDQDNKIQVIARHRNGQNFFAEIEYKKLYNDPNKLSVYALRDMTTLKKTQAELEIKNNELKKALHTKEKFLSIIAHDLKNPFTSIIGLLELMATRIKTQTKEKQLKFIQQVLNESKNTYALLENLLNWSKVEQNKMPFNPERLNLNDVCRYAMLNYEQLAKSKQITIQNKIPEDVYVTADQQMLQSIIRNLLSNALKYTLNNGMIQLQSTLVNKEKAQITISDNGTGIETEQLQKLQNNDDILSSLGTNKEEGTGLGLTIVNEFIRKHGSNLHIETKIKKGSAFSFQLSISRH